MTLNHGYAIRQDMDWAHSPAAVAQYIVHHQ